MEQNVFRVLNKIYGNDVVSLFELAEGYTLPLDEDKYMLEAPRETIEAHSVRMPKRKLDLILRSKAVSTPFISFGDLVDVFVKLSHQKRGGWIGPNKILQWVWTQNLLGIPKSM